MANLDPHFESHYQNDDPNLYNTSSEKSFLSKILAVIVCFFAIICILRLTMGRTNFPTFAGFLNTLQKVPVIDIPFLDFNVNVLGDWGLFNWLRDFFNLFIPFINIMIFIINGLTSVILYVTYFAKFIFIG